jgi:hypothetical protein
MDVTKVYQIRPSDELNTPREEQFKLSTNDYLSPPIFLNFCLYFPLSDNDAKDDIINSLRRGLANTLGQCRSLLGTIERSSHEDYAIVVTQASTVDFTVHSLDGADHEPQAPTFAELQQANFASMTLCDPAQLCAAIISSSPDPIHSPPVLAVQANFLRGGMALTIHFHHWALDFVGFGTFVHQWAQHTKAVIYGTPPPAWDLASLDRSRLSIQAPHAASKRAQNHHRTVPAVQKNAPQPSTTSSVVVQQPDPVCHLLFHLRKSKAHHLKSLLQNEHTPHISTYDAFTALWWRLLLRHKVKSRSNTDLTAPAPFFEAINMRLRLTPPLSPQFLGNALFLATSSALPEESQLSLGDVMHDAPLADVAAYVRRITSSANSASFYAGLEAPTDGPRGGRPPLALKMTDWRGPNVCAADFGFGRPTAMRQLFLGTARAGKGNVYIYPVREREDGEVVFEFAVPVEMEGVDSFRADGEVKEWFDFVAVEAET